MNRFFTYNEISHYLGVHPITIARMIKALKAEKMIQKFGHQICISDAEGMAMLITNERRLDY